jgi:predicted alpha/beta hydrolase family esterase
MRKQVLFIHSGGSQGIHEGSNDLVTYLRAMLGAEYDVLYPKMPDPESPEYETWKTLLAKEIALLQGELILIGHSLGGSVLLKYLSEEPCSDVIAGLFLIAAPFWGKKNWQVDEYALQEDFSSRLPGVSRIFLYHSLNDEVVPVSHLRFYAEKLPNATVRESGNRRHLFSKGLPQLIEDIKNLKLVTQG